MSGKIIPSSFLMKASSQCSVRYASSRLALLKSGNLYSTKALRSTKRIQRSKKKTSRQKQITDMFKGPEKAPSKSEVVGQELCSAILTANIPWYKLEVSQFRDFLETWIGISIPDQSTLCSKYLDGCYNEVHYQKSRILVLQQRAMGFVLGSECHSQRTCRRTTLD